MPFTALTAAEQGQLPFSNYAKKQSKKSKRE